MEYSITVTRSIGLVNFINGNTAIDIVQVSGGMLRSARCVFTRSEMRDITTTLEEMLWKDKDNRSVEFREAGFKMYMIMKSTTEGIKFMMPTKDHLLASIILGRAEAIDLYETLKECYMV